MKKHIVSALIIATSVLSAVSYADGHNKGDKKNPNKGHGSKHFSMIDANKDGKLSKSEMLNFHENHFLKMDANSDGFISQQEMKAKNKSHHKGKKMRLMKMDSNKDGVVSDEEKSIYKKARKEKKECLHNIVDD